MNIVDLGNAAAAQGYALIRQDMLDALLEQTLEAEELRCDLAALSASLVEQAITDGLGTR